jgi:hypothetical protein
LDAGLSKVSSEWMLVEAQTSGLEIDDKRADTILGRLPPPFNFLPNYVKPNANGTLHESLKGAWWLLEYFPRSDPRTHGLTWQLPRGKSYRKIPEGSFIHESVLDGGYATQRLPRQYSIVPWNKFRAEAETSLQSMAHEARKQYDSRHWYLALPYFFHGYRGNTPRGRGHGSPPPRRCSPATRSRSPGSDQNPSPLSLSTPPQLPRPASPA